MGCINNGPGTEAINQTYLSDPFQALAIDLWDGGVPQVDIFANASGVTFPILMYGGSAGLMTSYNTSSDFYFVVGGDGIILWRGFFNDTDIRGAIDQGLAELVSPAPEVPFAANRLLEAYPNPFNPVTRIPFELENGAGDQPVTLQILDLRGRLVSTLVNGAVYAEGRRHEVTWDGTDNAGGRQPSGTYLVRLRAGGTDQMRMLTLVK